jgi:hypothetical protein
LDFNPGISLLQAQFATPLVGRGAPLFAQTAYIHL